MSLLSATCRELVPTADINLAASLMQLLYSLMDEWRTADAAKALVGCLTCPVLMSQHMAREGIGINLAALQHGTIS